MIPVNTPLLDGNEKKYLIDCIDTGWISSEGPYIRQFEENFSRYIGRKFGIAVCNGSVAIDVALTALGLTVGDEVILPTFTIISCAAAIVRCGAIPVLVDSDPKTWNMSTQEIEKKITKKTKAIMVVHIYGLPVDMDPILSLAQKYNLKIVEDAAEMHGQTYKGKKCGSFGDISTFSFYPNKHLTTGEGGMILTDNVDLAKKCASLKNLCFVPEKRFIHYDLGWNFRMTNLQAALGCAQLERIDSFVDKKRKMGHIYRGLLGNIPGIELPPEKIDGASNIYWVFGILLKDEVPFNAEAAMKMLADEQVGTRPFFYPMHLQPILNKMGFFKNERFPIAEKFAERGFYLPSGLGLLEEQMHTVALRVRKILGAC